MWLFGLVGENGRLVSAAEFDFDAAAGALCDFHPHRGEQLDSERRGNRCHVDEEPRAAERGLPPPCGDKFGGKKGRGPRANFGLRSTALCCRQLAAESGKFPEHVGEQRLFGFAERGDWRLRFDAGPQLFADLELPRAAKKIRYLAARTWRSIVSIHAIRDRPRRGMQPFCNVLIGDFQLDKASANTQRSRARGGRKARGEKFHGVESLQFVRFKDSKIYAPLNWDCEAKSLRLIGTPCA